MSFAIPQNLYINDPTIITVTKCNEDALTLQHLQPFLDGTDRTLGVSATYGKQCHLTSIAFSVLSRVLVVYVSTRNTAHPREDWRQQRVTRSRTLIQEQLLLNPRFQKYAFKMDQVAAALHLDLSLRVSHAVDMLSVSNEHRQSLQALMIAMGGEPILQKTNVKCAFFKTKGPVTLDAAARVALQAWGAYRAATLPHMTPNFAPLRKINTSAFQIEHLDAVAIIARHADRLEALKPNFLKNDVRDQFDVNIGGLNVVCGRFPTRIRKSTNQIIRITMRSGESTNHVMMGRAREVDGRSAHINVKGPIRGDRIVSVMTFGKDDPTPAESTRQAITLKILQQRGTNVLLNPFFRALWLPREQPVWPGSRGNGGTVPVYFPGDLNDSQHAAVERILSNRDEDRIVMVQGPPGTGKTTVIAASVISHHHAQSRRGIWVAAQSNVAVKNIAEKFMREGFSEFRILVSKDFHYQWHEHLYEELERRVIRSDKFGESVLTAERRLLDCKVILCTLSMFSHPQVGVFLSIVPVEMIILDEASQIECGNYLPVFHLFGSSLAKLVFVGDDKQLPPFGQDDILELRSVFEFSHLRRRALFLNTQYRMPHVIGNFISENVYGGELLTHHNITISRACRFIDVHTGEEDKSGHSWVNKEEARVVVKLARIYESTHRSFRIITPYDAQRTLIEDLLQAEQLHWGDKVFNVDSFQGNEDDHIIISVVRTGLPGFLKSQRRTNVMLTRCKKSMIVCSNRAFLLGTAHNTLVGRLATSLTNENWIDGDDVL